MARTFYTKCGRVFSKSINASVTGYHMEDSDIQCHGDAASGMEPCPFRLEVTKGWPPVFERWECRAGSKEPNKNNEWKGSLEDKTNLSIYSLHIEFLQQVIQYCKDHEDITCGYNQDLEDCRRALSITIAQNKKGIAAKKALVERFFPEGQKVMEYDGEIKHQVKVVGEDAAKEPKYKVRCPYLSVIGGNYIQCTLYARHMGEKKFPSGETTQEHVNNICYDNFDKCEIYRITYEKEMASQEKYVLENRKCAFCCNNSLYTGLKEHSGSTHGFCQLLQEDKELFNPITVCEWFNKKYRTQESVNIKTREEDVSECCPYYGGVSQDGHKIKLKCGENSYIALEDEGKKQEHIEYCKTGYKACRAYTRTELERLGIDLGPASPQKTKHLIALLKDFYSKEESCTSCQSRGEYNSYIEDTGDFYWKCAKETYGADSIASNVISCRNYKRVNSISEGVEDMELGKKCDRECNNKRDGMCTVEDIKGGALKYFIMDDAASDCSVIKKLTLKYLSEERHCGHAHEACTAVIRKCTLKNEYCCYTCQEPCNSKCGHAINLVPLGKIKAEDKSIPAGPVAVVHDISLDGHLSYIEDRANGMMVNQIEIGFALIDIQNKELYREKGYDNLVTCVKEELGMGKSTCYNYIKIANVFGDPQNRSIKDEFSRFSYVQLVEMATMNKDTLAQVTPEMSKREMSNLKKNSNRLDSDTAIEVEYTVVAPQQENKDEKVIDLSREPERQIRVENLIPEKSGTSLAPKCPYFSRLNGLRIDCKHDAAVNCVSEGTRDLYYKKYCCNDFYICSKYAEDPDGNSIADNSLKPSNVPLSQNREQQADRNTEIKDGLRELLAAIDKDFSKLSKKQIRNSICKFLDTGEIVFSENE